MILEATGEMMNRCPTVPKHGGKVIKEHEKTINKKVNSEIARRGKGGGGIKEENPKNRLFGGNCKEVFGFLASKKYSIPFPREIKTRK